MQRVHNKRITDRAYFTSFAIIAVTGIPTGFIDFLLMNLNQKFGLSFLAVLLAICVWYFRPETLNVAPNVVFKTLHGDSIALADLKGKPVLVTFWATDCENCLKEIPDLIKLHQQGLTIIAVNMYYDPPDHVLEVSTAKELPYAVAIDPYADQAEAFGNVQFTPTTFLFDATGKVLMQKIGRFELAAVQRLLGWH